MYHVKHPELQRLISCFIFRITMSTMLLTIILLCSMAGNAKAAAIVPTDLTELSLEELMNIEITSVSKKPERLADAVAAIFVITQEDIRRSGVTCIPEALRMVPGINVARIDSNKWAITSRGFNGRYAGKLLVLMDGRSVYTPLYSGVYWDIQDTLMEDIERIEVIRGPGATLWGANAVNGVINIITKMAKDTLGRMVTAGFGNEEHWFGGVRYGTKLGNDTYFRIYAKGFDRDNAVFASGEEGHDRWKAFRSGFRFDSKESDRNSFTLQGDVYDGESDQRTSFIDQQWSTTSMRIMDDSIDLSGANILGRWSHEFSDTSDMTLQFYYDRTEREDVVLGETRDTVDIDFQHSFKLDNWHQFVWGVGYRYTQDNMNNHYIFLHPESREDDLLNAFIQDQVTLIENRLRMTLGSKFEYNDYTGFEFQPTVRLFFTPKEEHTIWTAVSRAVRTPSRIDDDIRINYLVTPFPPPYTVFSIFGDRDFESEELIAYEIGWRFMPTERLSADIAAFYNIYDNIRSIEAGQMYFEFTPGSHWVIPAYFENMLEGETYGVEIETNWKPVDNWQLSTGYSFLQLQLHSKEGSSEPSPERYEKSSPHNQIHIRSKLDLPYNLEFDQSLYYVDNVPFHNIKNYIRVDIRLGWRPTQNLEASVCGQNLFDGEHIEFKDESAVETEVKRSVYGKVTWKF